MHIKYGNIGGLLYTVSIVELLSFLCTTAFLFFWLHLIKVSVVVPTSSSLSCFF